MEEKKRYIELDIAKGIGIFLVVFGHSFPDASEGIFNNNIFYMNLEHFIYGFHMPLFIFLSGFLSSKIYNSKSFKDKILYLKNRFMRIGIPYIFIYIVSFCMKLLLNRYAVNKVETDNILSDFLLGHSSNGGLWFLYVLFLIDIIMLILNFIDIRIVCICSFALSCFFGNSMYGDNNFKKIGFYLFFFSLGIFISMYYEKIKNKFNVYLMIISALLCIFTKALNTIYLNTINAMLMIFVIMSLSIIIMNKCQKISGLLSKLGMYSMDIYIISYFVQVPIRIMLFQKLNLSYEFCFVIMLLGGLLGSVLISKYIVRKIKVLNMLVLGR